MATHALRIAWLLNLDADRELQDPARYRPAELARTRPDWRARMADLVADDDLILPSLVPRPGELGRAVALLESGVAIASSTNGAFDTGPDTIIDHAHAGAGPEARHGAIVAQCFCPTPSALAQLSALGFAVPEAPSLAILRMVNGRAFCAELGQCLPSSSFVHDMDALEQQLAHASPTGRYVVKRAFSFAGREQRRVQDGVLDESTRGFCQRSFARGEGVQVEPWVERLADLSRHGFLTRAGALTIGPTREQRCDAHGRFLGVLHDAPSATSAEAEQLATELQRTAAALTAAGYFGPFGIDGFRYRTSDGGTALNPRCEINARFTMGYPRALLLEALRA